MIDAWMQYPQYTPGEGQVIVTEQHPCMGIDHAIGHMNYSIGPMLTVCTYVGGMIADSMGYSRPMMYGQWWSEAPAAHKKVF